MIKKSIILAYSFVFLFGQGDFNLQDVNPSSETYGQLIGPSDYIDEILIIFFGHEY